MSDPYKHKIRGRRMFLAACVDCGAKGKRAWMHGLPGDQRCQKCYAIAQKKGILTTHTTYILNGKEVTEEEFKAHQ